MWRLAPRLARLCLAAQASAALLPGLLSLVGCPQPSSIDLPPLALEQALGHWKDAGEFLTLDRWRYRQGPQVGEIWIAHIKPEGVQLSVEVASNAPRRITEITSLAEREPGDYLAINGGFYDDSGPLGLVVSHGHQVKRFRSNGGSGVFVVAGSVPEIMHRDAFKPSPEIHHALQSIDRLVADGESLVRERTQARSDARSLVGIDDHLHLVLAVAYDARAVSQETAGVVYLNRQTTSTGVTLRDLAEFAARDEKAGGLGLRWALNLDGGWSTALHARIEGQPHGVVGYRGTINAIQARIPPAVRGSP
ncbi:MAG: phosphodiester glycosidase family protein [Pseudomonadota bacterium]